MSETGTAPQTASILVLPGGLAESLAFRENAIDRGMPLVGASSLRNDPAAAQYENWCYLPTVHEPGFEADFQSVLERYRVKTVFCPHPILHARLGDPFLGVQGFLDPIIGLGGQLVVLFLGFGQVGPLAIKQVQVSHGVPVIGI